MKKLIILAVSLALTAISPLSVLAAENSFQEVVAKYNKGLTDQSSKELFQAYERLERSNEELKSLKIELEKVNPDDVDKRLEIHEKITKTFAKIEICKFIIHRTTVLPQHTELFYALGMREASTHNFQEDKIVLDEERRRLEFSKTSPAAKQIATYYERLDKIYESILKDIDSMNEKEPKKTSDLSIFNNTNYNSIEKIGMKDSPNTLAKKISNNNVSLVLNMTDQLLEVVEIDNKLQQLENSEQFKSESDKAALKEMKEKYHDLNLAAHSVVGFAEFKRDFLFSGVKTASQVAKMEIFIKKLAIFLEKLHVLKKVDGNKDRSAQLEKWQKKHTALKNLKRELQVQTKADRERLGKKEYNKAKREFINVKFY